MLPFLLHHLLELDLKWCDDHNLVPCRVAWKVKSEHYPDLGSDASSVWNFQRSFLRPHFAGKPVLMSRNVGYFLRLEMPVPRILLNIIYFLTQPQKSKVLWSPNLSVSFQPLLIHGPDIWSPFSHGPLFTKVTAYSTPGFSRKQLHTLNR